MGKQAKKIEPPEPTPIEEYIARQKERGVPTTEKTSKGQVFSGLHRDPDSNCPSEDIRKLRARR